MKICYITPFPPQKGGISDYSSNLIDEIKKSKDNDISIISFKNPKQKENNKNVFHLLSLSPFSLFKIYKIIVTKKPDVIHIQYDLSNYMLMTIPLFLLLTLIKNNIYTKLVITFHEPKRDYDLWGLLTVMFYKINNIIFDRIYIHSQESYNILKNICRIKDSKLKIIPHPVYTFKKQENKVKFLKDAYNCKDEYVILYFGFIYKEKGIEYLIKAINELCKLKDYQNKIKLLIVGEVPKRNGILKIFEIRNKKYLKSLKKLTTDLKLDSVVEFTGYIETKNIYSLFNLASIVVLPYIKADQSGVLNYAIAANKPVIASNLGGLKESLRNAGVLVKPQDYNSIKNNIIKLIKNKYIYKTIKHEYKKIKRSTSTKHISLLINNDYKNLVSN
jgi:glycosyltransferase involved in cell wall biosynthesis